MLVLVEHGNCNEAKQSEECFLEGYLNERSKTCDHSVLCVV